VQHESKRRSAIPARVFVGNLSFQTTRDELTRLLAEAGTIQDAHLPMDRETGKARGFAFIEFATDAEAAEAIRLFNGRELGGRALRINLAEERARGAERPRGAFSPRGADGPRFSDRDSPRGADRDSPRGGERSRPSWNSAPAEGPIFFAVDGRASKPKGSRRGVRARKRG
jgi:RNA recognition motif-containing protein